MAFFVTARRAVPHRPPRMLPHLRPAYSRPPCLFYATSPRTPHSCILSVPRRAMYSLAAPHSRSNSPNGTTPSHPADNNRLIPKRRPLRRITHPLILPARRTNLFIPPFHISQPRLSLLVYNTAPHPKQPPDTARPIPPAHTSPPTPRSHKKPQRPTPVRVGLCGYRVAEWRKELPADPCCYAFLLLM